MRLLLCKFDRFSHNKPLYVLGDFNLPNPSHIQMLNKMLKKHHLVQIIDEPTRNQNILDLIVTNSESRIVSKNVFHPHLSDHKLIECTIDIIKPKLNKKTIQYRAYNKINYDKLNDTLSKLKLLPHINDVECSCENLINQISNIFNSVAPLKTIKVNQSSYIKRISDETRTLIVQRNKAYKQCKKTPTHSNKLKVKTIKKQVRRSTLTDTRMELASLIEQCGFWDSVKLTKLLKNKPTSNIAIHPDVINDFFIGISTPKTTQQQQHSYIQQSAPNFNFSNLTSEDILLAWKKTKNPRNPSEDPLGISNKMIQICMHNDNFISILVILYNCCIDNNVFPKMFKLSKIIPIPKITDPKSPNDLRPISIQPVLAKLLEKCMYKQLISYLESNHLLSPNQFGFRPKHSTSHACISFSDKIHNNTNEEKVTIAVSVDIKKAFDTVNRNVLLSKLDTMGIDILLFNSYFTDRYQFVTTKINDKTVSSTSKTPLLGIPQGSSLSGILFNCLINDLPNSVKYCEATLYADDTGLVGSEHVKKINVLTKNIETDLLSLSRWFDVNQLEINPDKIFFTIFCADKFLPILNNVVILMNGRPLKQNETLKLLGVTFDRKLSMNEHVEKACKKCNLIINDMLPLKNLLSIEKKELLVNACVFSVLNYCSPICFQNRSNYMNILKVMKRAARFVFGKRFYDSVSNDMYNNLKWLSPPLRYKFDVCCMAFKITREICPQVFLDYLCVDDFDIHCTRGSQYYVCTDRSLSKNSFKYNVSKEWLELPEYIQKEPYFKTFKKLLFNFLRDNTPNDNSHSANICNLSCIESAINP